MLEALIISGAVGLAIGTYLYIRRPPIVRRHLERRSPADEVAARLRAVVPDELIESIEVDLDDRCNPIALQLSRDPSADEQAKINRACTRAIRDLYDEAGLLPTASPTPPAETPSPAETNPSDSDEPSR